MHFDPMLETQACNRSCEGISALSPPVHKQDPKFGPRHGNNQPWHTSSGSQIGT